MRSRITPLAAASLLALVGIDAWLLATIIDDAFLSEDPSPVRAPDWSPKVSGSTELVLAKPIVSYDQTLRRPLFFKKREPFVPRPPAAPPKPAPPPVVQKDPGLVLGGVVIDHNIKKAYLFTRADPHGAWVSEGENFMGWKVQSVDSNSTTLQQNSRFVELHLYPQ
ncbi:MAG TPA: hypothetical protein VH684_19130 [Xanthobacteraceae bacterium]|jgi:hypothetical protein